MEAKIEEPRVVYEPKVVTKEEQIDLLKEAIIHIHCMLNMLPTPSFGRVDRDAFKAHKEAAANAINILWGDGNGES